MLLNLIKLLILAGILYFVIKAIIDSSPIVRRICLGLFVISIFGIEYYLRLAGNSPYFSISTAYQDCFSKIVRVDSLQDDHIFWCDSFGVNKINSYGKYRSELSLLNSDGFRSLPPRYPTPR